MRPRILGIGIFFAYARNSFILASILLAWFFFLVPASAFSQEKSSKETSSSGVAGVFRTNLAALVEKGCLKGGKVGLKVISLSRGDVLFSYGEASALIPASNVKLFTAAAALKALGPHYRFRTTLAVLPETKVENGSLKGDLYLKGWGDPSLVSEMVWLIAKDLKLSGIGAVGGDIVIDESYFDLERFAPGWGTYEKERAYNPPTGAFSVNFNSIALHIQPSDKPGEKATVKADPDTGYLKVENQLVTGSRGDAPSIEVKRKRWARGDVAEIRGKVPAGGAIEHHYLSVSDPPAYGGWVLLEMLAKEGISVSGGIKLGELPLAHKVILEHRSKPLWQIVADMNKYSNNFIAEQLLKVVGAEARGKPGAFIDGLAAVNKFAEDAVSIGGAFKLADGSGLSRENRLSAAKIVGLLAYMRRDFEAGPEFMASLGIAGGDGILEKRLAKTEAQHKMRLKSGWLYGAGSLSGYALSRGGEHLAFSSIMNSASCDYPALKAIQDELSLLLVGFKR